MARAAVLPPTSPPKKTSRGRPRTKTTGAESDTNTKTKSKTTKGKTATSTTEPKRRVGRPPSRKVEVESDDGTDDEIDIIETRERSKALTIRGKNTTGTTSAGPSRGRKAVTPAPVESGSDDDDELAQSDVPKRPVGRPRTKPVPKEDADAKPGRTAPRGRGRPKGAKSAKVSATKEDEKETGRRKTRVKGSSDSTAEPGPKSIYITTGSTMARSNTLRGPMKKKKTVTFKDVSGSEAEEEDEDNLPALPAIKGRRATSAQEGLLAKPVRKPATGTGRGHKPATAKDGASIPLSPKKANQITKTLSSYLNSDGEEDELSAEKNKTKLVVNSPAKHDAERTGLTSPVRRVNFTPNKPKTFDENGELTLHPARAIDFSDSVYMSSPARRPTASPFQFTMKETPKRGGRGVWGETKSIAQSNLSPIQDSPLKLSPKKGKLGVPMAIAQPSFRPNESVLNASPKKGSPMKGVLGAPFLPVSQPGVEANSPLKISPKKGGLGDSFSRPPATDLTPFNARASLIQSPAKRIVPTFRSSMTLRNGPIHESVPTDTDNEGHLGASTCKISSPSPVKAGRPQEMSPVVPEYSEDEAQLTAEVDAVEMVEETIPEPELTEHEKPNYTADRSNDKRDEDMDSLVNELEENERRHTEYDAYDCTYLQEEVSDNVDECQRQLDYYSKAERTKCFDDNRQESKDDPTEQPGIEMDQSGDGDLMPGVESEPQTPQRMSMPSDIEDVFVDTPRDDRAASGAVMEENGTGPEEIDGDDSVDAQTEEQATPGNARCVEQRDEGTQMASNEHESRRLGSRRASLVLRNKKPEQYEDSLEHPVDAQGSGPDTEEGGKNTHITSNNSGPYSESPWVASPYEVYEGSGSVTPTHIPPPVPTPPVDTTAANHGDAFRDTGRYSMASNDTTMFGSPETRNLGSAVDCTPFKRDSLEKRQSLFKDSLGFTPLANQFSQWKAGSPGKLQPESRQRRGVFSLGGLKKPSDTANDPREVSYPDISKHPLADSQSLSAELRPQGDTEIRSAIYEDQGREPEMAKDDVPQSVGSERQPMSEIMGSPEHEMTTIDHEEATPDETVPASNPGESPAPSVHSVHGLQRETSEKENKAAEPFVPNTPVENKINSMRTVHTVSKVPLRPEGEVSPVKNPRKRPRSPENTMPIRASTRPRKSISYLEDDDAQSEPPRKMRRLQESSSRQVLQGVVAHVDVHTTEGEDASGIFIELLQQMGARCVKHWAWNPRSSSSPVDGSNSKDGKVGITHVVFKDGGVRTLEKVRQAAGVVKCVGVGWVLDCEREDKWLDEKHYAVDSSIIPRGGANRRKSMLPHTLSNVNGTLVKNEQPAVDRETMEDFMKLSPPMASRNLPGTPEKATEPANSADFQTPTAPGFNFNMDDIGMSPATPFFLQRQNIIQQTCPPKQTRQGLFSASPSEDDDLSSQRLKFKLEAARRKSHAFKPRVRSPLSK